MSDFLSGLGGLIKGMQPIMGEEVQKDASMKAFLLKTDISELRDKKQSAFARIGLAVYEANQQSGRYSEFTEFYSELEEIDRQLSKMELEMEAAQNIAEEKQRAEEQKRDALTCRNCGNENKPDTKFCSECGEKLGLPTMLRCAECGAQNSRDTKFCGECGTKL